jgi:hypothetical protein
MSVKRGVLVLLVLICAVAHRLWRGSGHPGA